MSNVDYTTCDIRPGAADEVIDVTSIDKPSASYDVVICSHVLEHVDDDRRAMQELRRVLAGDGWAMIQAPVIRATTDEDATVVDPDERMARFGQEDHVRAYGPDLYDRLASAGFVVEDASDALRPADRKRYGLYAELTPQQREQGFVEIPICRPI